MRADTWTALGLGLTVVSSVGVWAAARRARRDAPAVSVAEVLSWAALLAIAIWLRFGFVPSLNAGRLSVDESQAARSYVASIVHFEPSIFGGTNLTHAWLLDLWYRAFGVGVYSPRYYAAAAGSCGLLFFFAALRLLVGLRAAAWATLLLGLSTYSVYFSVAALEQSSLMLAAPLCAFLFAAWLRKPDAARAAALGVAVGLSAFTYPGILLGYASLFAGWAACAGTSWWRARPHRVTKPFGDAAPRGLWVAAASLGAVLVAGYLVHQLVYSELHRLFHGGGDLNTSWSAFREALPVVLGDLFLETRTWHLPLRQVAFVDWTYWAPAAFGALVIWTRERGWLARGAVVSVAVLVLLVPLCGAYPGMRRGLVILFPVCALAGVGIAELWARPGRLLGGVLALLAIAAPLTYQATIGGQDWRRGGYGQSYGADPFPDALLLAALEKHDLIVSTDEFAHGLDRQRVRQFARLAARHGAFQSAGHDIAFVGAAEPRRVSALAQAPSVALLTWRPRETLPALARGASLCFGVEGLEQRPALVRLVPLAAAQPQDVCAWQDGQDVALTSCARLGAGHLLARIGHDVTCDGAQCDSWRLDNVWVEPGAVSLRLRPPRASGSIRLVLRHAPAPDSPRANRIWVNDTDIGVVAGTATAAGGQLSLEVPREAQRAAAAWSIRIGPANQAGRTGWDVESVGLVADGDAAACPATLCVGHANGEVCEDARTHTLRFLRKGERAPAWPFLPTTRTSR